MKTLFLLMLATTPLLVNTMREQFAAWEYQTGRTQTPMFVTWDGDFLTAIDVDGLTSSQAVAQVQSVTSAQVDAWRAATRPIPLDPHPTVPIVDAQFRQIGTATEVIYGPTWTALYATNSASPQREWIVQTAELARRLAAADKALAELRELKTKLEKAVVDIEALKKGKP